jgi:citrate-Mg2+:H+ or citrate-Ca2+:H+ symporter, CitMHS family
MVAIVGALAVAGLLALILSNRLSPIVALILTPALAVTAIGQAAALPALMLAGMGKIAPVAGMFVFAILFFGVMTDAGLLDPVIRLVLRLAGDKPARITLGTALLALLVHLDGSGAVCFLVTIPALRPLYDRLALDRRVLACTASMAAGVNFLPWTGPTLRASASLGVSTTALFTPMIGAQVVGIAFVLAASWWLGAREARRIAGRAPAGGDHGPRAATRHGDGEGGGDSGLRRPRLLAVNALLTAIVVGAMVAGVADPAVIFMIGAAMALLINYPDARAQRDRVDAHARAALLMAAILFAAGAFTGVMTGSGMIGAMAKAAASAVPVAIGAHLPVLVGVAGMPLSLLFDPDSFYFGVLPVVAEVTHTLGGQPVDVARAALLGQMTVGFPVSPLTLATFLVVGLSGIELGAHQRFSIPYLLLASVVMTIAAVLLGVIPW